MCALRFRVPPHDVKLVETKSHTIELTLPADGEYFVTVIAYDKHGEEVGRKLYPLSEELRLTRPPVIAVRPAGQDPARR